ncbi:F0F1 ATP synthase subunit B [Stomatohabitans albus]|uniref:F0F1 ATP synthase subunit B n=1 Tax=Stomatohabitans albus TaxID=3110766 RepID=UPI00300C9B34
MVVFAEGDPNALQLLPEVPELVFGLISFAIVLFFLSKFAFPTLNKVLEERRQAIQGQLEEADKAVAEAKKSQDEYAALLKEAHLEANQLIEKTRQDADVQRESIVRKAKQEAEKIRDDAHTAAVAEHQRILREARDEIGDLAMVLASRIVRREIDVERHSDLVDEFINELASK